MKNNTKNRATDKGKKRLKPIGTDSTPITRHGYRLGRSADKFWITLNIPGTPPTQKKNLRVLPFITKNEEHTEYLVDNTTKSFSPITTTHIAVQLACVPWTLLRARQHIANEVAHALHKVLMFHNQYTTPFQKWSQGRWQLQWTESSEKKTYLHIIRQHSGSRKQSQNQIRERLRMAENSRENPRTP
jgi:hypothetical protein